MKQAVSMWSLEASLKKNKLKQKDFILWAAGKGIKYVELISYYMDEENNPEETAQLLAEQGMSVSCYTILSDFTDEAAYTSDNFQKDLDTAVIIGAPFIRVLAGECEKGGTDKKKLLIERLTDAAARAAEKDVILVMENIGTCAGSSDEIIDIITSVNSKHLKINFDTANPLLADESPIAALNKMIDHIAYVHLKDFVTEHSSSFKELSSAEWRIQISRKGTKMTGTIPGKGEVDISSILTILRDSAYDGFVSVEYENDLYPEKAVEESLALLKQYT